MALVCGVQLNSGSYSAGQTPSPLCTVVVYNPNASAVSVTAMDIFSYPMNSSVIGRTPRAQNVPPIGQGQTVSVAALSSLNVGPFPIAFGSASAANPFLSQNNGAPYMSNPQLSQPPSTIFMIGARVYGSDGSVNEASPAGLTVSYAINPPAGFQGGQFNYNGANNAPNWFWF